MFFTCSWAGWHRSWREFPPRPARRSWRKATHSTVSSSTSARNNCKCTRTNCSREKWSCYAWRASWKWWTSLLSPHWLVSGLAGVLSPPKGSWRLLCAMSHFVKAVWCNSVVKMYRYTNLFDSKHKNLHK